MDTPAPRYPPLGLALVGCGNIAAPYARFIVTYPELAVRGVFDIERGRGEALAAPHGWRVYADLDAALDDRNVELVVNLTPQPAHAEIVRRCLDAGKHVYTEKPLALSYQEARALVDLARARGVRLGAAPCTYLGEAQATAWRWLRDGRLGHVRLAYAEVNWGRIETWHPAPEPFYAVGPLFDVGVYPLTLLTTFFGAARRVWAYSAVMYPERVTRDGATFRIETPDFVVVMVEHETGTLARLTTNFYVSQHSKQTGIELHSDSASLFLGSWAYFNAAVEFAPWGQPYAPVPLLRPAPHTIDWGRALHDIAIAVREERPHRATGEHAAHVVEIVTAAAQAARLGRAVSIHSRFTPPAPPDWG